MIRAEDYDVVFDDTYHIVSLYDKRARREVLSAPAGLVAYEDYPYDYDAWELSDYYRDKPWPVDKVQSAEIVSEGESAGGLEKPILRLCWRMKKLSSTGMSSGRSRSAGM